MDNVIDRTIYPLDQQEFEAKNKRRMGLGVLGLANVGELLGYSYGSPKFITFEGFILASLRNACYEASINLAKDKGAFPLYDDRYLDGLFIQGLPSHISSAIEKHGIRNSHLTSIAPTGTIHITAGGVSSGIEPPYALEYERTIQGYDGPEIHKAQDYAYREWNVAGKTADETTVDEHLNVLATAQKYVDSAVSKTCNCGPEVSYQDFMKIYLKAWAMGCKGVSTFRSSGKRMGILKSKEPVAEACFIDPETGERSCG